ncbi:hypothetical protein GPECTOR_99g812 [Gonium pectorale]|uniref:DNA replication licensing factor MCM4 n=1 Tax=Gonium pectorale TaxID=33097 RepID=A0A150G013_GONPE|nr:hypothetical protein GPECTOR_99g812 [Gonium pectorale]|eukprot:KXZ43177.1 hypothetical protein GPECTOR_99g812 [Gonium pectorale]
MEEDAVPQGSPAAANGNAEQEPSQATGAPSQQGGRTPAGGRRVPRGGRPSLSGQHATPQHQRRRPQPAPSGSALQGSQQQQAASEGTLGNATPLPRGLVHANRGEFGGAQRRPSVRVGGGPARSASTAMQGASEGGLPDADGAAAEDLPPAYDGSADDGTYVWGTNINSRHLRQQIDSFIRGFRTDPDAEPKYVQIIREALEAGEASVNIDTADMRATVDGVSYDKLYEALVDFPREVHCVLDEVVREVAVMDLQFEPELERQQAMDLCLLVCRPYNLAVTKHIRDLDPSDIDKLVCIKGMVTRTSAVIPNLRGVGWVVQKDAEPSILSAPNTPADSQRDGGEGGPGQTDTQAAEDPLVAIENITAEELREVEGQIKELSRDPRLVDRLIASLAPNIWEMDDIKKGVLCQLFGGVPKTFPGGRIRGELNVLLVGDPSVSKSQLLTYVHQLAPRGIYTSGKGSSAVGLTAYVTKDPETREMVLESGALVLSDRGVCCIDEFDKMSDSARSMLHEAMEQQTVSVAKAGLISTLNARCSVLACANPVGSRYNPQMSIAENINLPPTLLTRFDLIYLVLDRYEESRDRRLARHLVSLFHPGAQGRSRVAGAGGASVLPVPPDLLKKYVAYARARCTPRLTDEAAEELVSRYQTLRRDGRDRKVVMATPRQLESLIRIAESLARMRLDERIKAADVAEAVRLWYGAMAGSAGSGSGDGRPDMDTLYCGTTAAQREAQRGLPDEVRKIFAGKRIERSIALDDLLRDINSRLAAAGPQTSAYAGGISRTMLVTALRQLDDLVVYDEMTNTVRPVHRAGGGGQAAKEGPPVVGAAEVGAVGA